MQPVSAISAILAHTRRHSTSSLTSFCRNSTTRDQPHHRSHEIGRTITSAPSTVNAIAWQIPASAMIPHHDEVRESALQSPSTNSTAELHTLALSNLLRGLEEIVEPFLVIERDEYQWMVGRAIQLYLAIRDVVLMYTRICYYPN